MTADKTWIRVQDEFAQFDHPKGAPLPKGVTEVKGADEYVGAWARDPKRRTDKAGKSVAKTPAKSSDDDTN